MVLQQTTTTQLLEGLFDPGASDIWRAFDERYRPIIVSVARRLGLGEEEAADVAQETITRFIEAYRRRKYDRTRGRLRSWIIGIARHLIADRYASIADRAVRRGQSALDVVPGEEELTTIWEAERRTVIMTRALEELRTTSRLSEKSIRAFEMVGLARRRPDEVAAELGMTRHDVYVAKHRVTERLRDLVAGLEQLYDAEA